jgi:hypothetical protein
VPSGQRAPPHPRPGPLGPRSPTSPSTVDRCATAASTSPPPAPGPRPAGAISRSAACTAPSGPVAHPTPGAAATVPVRAPSSTHSLECPSKRKCERKAQLRGLLAGLLPLPPAAGRLEDGPLPGQPLLACPS